MINAVAIAMFVVLSSSSSVTFMTDNVECTCKIRGESKEVRGTGAQTVIQCLQFLDLVIPDTQAKSTEDMILDCKPGLYNRSDRKDL